jgi:hypothetical protein
MTLSSVLVARQLMIFAKGKRWRAQSVTDDMSRRVDFQEVDQVVRKAKARPGHRIVQGYRQNDSWDSQNE